VRSLNNYQYNNQLFEMPQVEIFITLPASEAAKI
jgi:hypothetical protein